MLADNSVLSICSVANVCMVLRKSVLGWVVVVDARSGGGVGGGWGGGVGWVHVWVDAQSIVCLLSIHDFFIIFFLPSVPLWASQPPVL